MVKKNLLCCIMCLVQLTCLKSMWILYKYNSGPFKEICAPWHISKLAWIPGSHLQTHPGVSLERKGCLEIWETSRNVMEGGWVFLSVCLCVSRDEAAKVEGHEKPCFRGQSFLLCPRLCLLLSSLSPSVRQEISSQPSTSSGEWTYPRAWLCGKRDRDRHRGLAGPWVFSPPTTLLFASEARWLPCGGTALGEEQYPSLQRGCWKVRGMVWPTKEEEAQIVTTDPSGQKNVLPLPIPNSAGHIWGPAFPPSPRTFGLITPGRMISKGKITKQMRDAAIRKKRTTDWKTYTCQSRINRSEKTRIFNRLCCPKRDEGEYGKHEAETRKPRDWLK